MCEMNRLVRPELESLDNKWISLRGAALRQVVYIHADQSPWDWGRTPGTIDD